MARMRKTTLILLFSMTLILLLTKSQVALAETSISDFNPISHWDCDETSGVRYDANLTNTNDLTDNNTVLYGTGLLSNACDFERDNSEYLSITDANQTNLDLGDSGSDYTISVWVKFETFNASDITELWTKFNPTGNQRSLLAFVYNTSGNDFQVYVSQAGTDASNVLLLWNTSITWTTGVWYHIVFTSNGTNSHTLYINGNSEGTKTTTATPYNSTSDIHIGNNLQGGMYADALFDEFSVFPTELSSTQVTTLYNSGTPLPYTAPTSTPSSGTSTVTYTMEDDNIVFALGVIIFFLAFLWFGFIISAFRK